MFSTPLYSEWNWCIADKRKMSSWVPRHLMGDITELAGNESEIKWTLILLRHGNASTMENLLPKKERHRWHEHCCYMSLGYRHWCLSIMVESCELKSVNTKVANVHYSTNISKVNQLKNFRKRVHMKSINCHPSSWKFIGCSWTGSFRENHSVFLEVINVG